MNIADITTKDYDKKTTTLHFAKLAVANKELQIYHRFMSIIIYARGFALQKINPRIPVITYFELASVCGFLQLHSLDIYPKFKTLERLIKEIADDLYFADEIKPKQTEKSLHVADKLAVAKISSPSYSFWTNKFWATNDIANKVFEDRYQIDKESLLGGFINTEVNLRKLASKINPLGEGILFKIVKLYAEMDNNCHAYKPFTSKL